MNERDPQAFLEGTTRGFSSLPPDPVRRPNSPAVAIIAGAATGAIAYAAAPDALGVARDGSLDEIAAAAVAAGTYFISRLSAAHQCSSAKEQKLAENFNVVRGGVSGAAAGVPIAIGLKVLTDVVTTGGIITAGAILGAGGVWLYNRLKRVKRCKHCTEIDSCSHVVCRNCLRLHFPMEKALRCDETIALTWHALASQLQADGLNYFEAMELVRTHFHEWVPRVDSQDNPYAIDCEDFASWRLANKAVIGSFRGRVRSPKEKDWESVRKIEAMPLETRLK